MDIAVHKCVTEIAWKLKSLLRTIFFTPLKNKYWQYVQSTYFDIHRISYIRYLPCSNDGFTTVGWYLDEICEWYWYFLSYFFLFSGLAPLNARCEIAIFGVIHRSVLRLGRRQFHEFFRINPNPPRSHLRRYSLQLIESYINKSIVGYIWVYNLLPQAIDNKRSVKAFQKQYQKLLSKHASRGKSNWELLFNVRVPRNTHDLRTYLWSLMHLFLPYSHNLAFQRLNVQFDLFLFIFLSCNISCRTILRLTT